MHISKRAAGFHEPLAAEAAPWTDDAMSLFEWFRRAGPEVVDAALGPLQFHKGSWSGHVTIAGESVPADVAGDPDGPCAAHREALIVLKEQYATLTPVIGRELVRLGT